MGSFLGGLLGGISGGLKEKEKGGSLITRFKKAFSREESDNSSDVKDTTAEANTDTSSNTVKPPAMHKGGRVPKTGIYRMKRGEIVVPADLARAIEKRVKGKRTGARKAGRRSSRR
jgi:hypothetical protein